MGETNIDQTTQWTVEVQTVSEQSPKYLVFKRNHSERELAEKGGGEHSWDLNPMFRGGGTIRRPVDLEHRACGVCGGEDPGEVGIGQGPSPGEMGAFLPSRAIPGEGSWCDRLAAVRWEPWLLKGVDRDPALAAAPPTGQAYQSRLGSSRPGQPLRSSSQQGGPSVPPSDGHPSPLVIRVSLPSLTLRHCPGDGGEERMEKTERSPKETNSLKSTLLSKTAG